jgi:hypothetical protein
MANNKKAMDQQGPAWRVIAESVIGASHIRTGLPNQDAIHSWEIATQRSPVAIALADGHGSKKCFRSDTGARLAVQEAIGAIQEFCSYFSEESRLKASGREQLILKGLLARWKDRLDNNLSENLSSDFIQTLYSSSSSQHFAKIMQETNEDYWGRGSQCEVFTKEELNQLRDLTARVIEDFLLHQHLSTESLLRWRLRDLTEVLTSAWLDDQWLKDVGHRVGRELWQRFLLRNYQRIIDSCFDGGAFPESDWKNLKHITISTREQIDKVSSVIRRLIVQGLRQTWSDAFPDLSAIELIGGPWLARRIVERWTEVVKDDIQKKAFTHEEADEVLGNPLLAYGATLLAALVTNDFILYLQMGDGDILTVSETGHVARPIAKDLNLIANETYSLCLPNAWRLFRFGFQPLSDPLPALIMLSTDGYSNSYKTEDDFFKVAKDILEIARTEGETVIRQNLGTWLKETSEKASGDDITLGAILREDVLRLPEGADEHSHDQTAEIVPRDPEETGNANTLT